MGTIKLVKIISRQTGISQRGVRKILDSFAKVSTDLFLEGKIVSLGEKLGYLLLQVSEDDPAQFVVELHPSESLSELLIETSS